MIKKALVCGAGGFIGGHLARRLKAQGYWVRGVDITPHEFSDLALDDFALADLRDPGACQRAVTVDGGFDEVYQLAADMGGMGFIHSAVCEIMRNNVLINVNMVDAAANADVPRYFYSSSVCIYRDMVPGEPALFEDDAYPALPDNDYGWEKLYSERIVTAYGERTGMATRIARFQNTYGPEGTWTGGREKAPAAICRKVAEARDGDSIEIWGDGSAVRSYTYVDDLVDGILLLTRSDDPRPTNIGNPEYHSVLDLVDVVARAAGKTISTRSIDGPVGVQSRNFANDRIEALGWASTWPLTRGIALTYPWVAEQVEQASRTTT